jgi:two-component system cell cycle sensor histidine kinase/response regulator CckA
VNHDTHVRSARVLVVDDEPNVREFVDRALRVAGHVTTVAASGPEALGAAAKSGPYDLLLTDMRMPDMNGDELARRVRHLYPDIKVLYLTGFADQLFKHKGALWEDEAYLDKPATVTGLLQAVSLLLYGQIASAERQEASPGDE